MLVAIKNIASEFRFLRLIAHIQRNKAMFGYLPEISDGRIDVHDVGMGLTGKSLPQQVFGPFGRLSKEWISCLKSIDR